MENELVRCERHTMNQLIDPPVSDLPTTPCHEVRTLLSCLTSPSIACVGPALIIRADVKETEYVGRIVTRHGLPRDGVTETSSPSCRTVHRTAAIPQRSCSCVACPVWL